MTVLPVSGKDALSFGADCAGRIGAVYDTLSSTDKKIADYVLANGPQCAQLSVRAFADACGCSASTVVRFCRLLHYDGFADFKYDIRRAEAALPENDITLHPRDSIGSMMQRALYYACQSLRATVDRTDEVLLDEAAHQIIAAGNVQFCAIGSAGGVAQAACSQLLSLGIPACFFSDELQQLRLAACRKPGDVLIGINYNNAAKTVADAFMAAKAAGATTILITAVKDGILSSYSDYVFYTPLRRAGNSLNISTSTLCQSMLLQLLMLRVWQLDPDRFGQQTETIRNFTKMKLYDPAAETVRIDYASSNG
ncbi:MAG: MurR/RpiR family transcriptional regulator [Clostridia bacterium]|nr:MurR/RpiR family transcriptional regulator [Clostridia bacterium]